MYPENQLPGLPLLRLEDEGNSQLVLCAAVPPTSPGTHSTVTALEHFKGKRLDGIYRTRDMFKEQVYSTTMHGTRYAIPIACSRQDPYSTVKDANRSWTSKLGEKVLNYMRQFAM